MSKENIDQSLARWSPIANTATHEAAPATPPTADEAEAEADEAMEEAPLAAAEDDPLTAAAPLRHESEVPGMMVTASE